MFSVSELNAIADNDLEYYFHREPGAIRAYLDNFHGDLDCLENFEDDYVGSYAVDYEEQALGEYAQDMAVQLGQLSDLPDWIVSNIDWYNVGKDIRRDGDMYALQYPNRSGGDWYVFHNS